MGLVYTVAVFSSPGLGRLVHVVMDESVFAAIWGA